jgi:hypothetical protein
MANEQVTVIQLFDHHDERFLLETVQQGAKEGAHVYFHEASESYVVSGKPLSARQVERTVIHDQEEQARDMLKSGDTPGDVWSTLYISARSIGRLAKQEGIKLPYRWFSKAQQLREQRIQEGKCASCGGELTEQDAN